MNWSNAANISLLTKGLGSMGCLQPYFKVVISSSDNIYFYFYFIFSFAVNGSGTFFVRYCIFVSCVITIWIDFVTLWFALFKIYKSGDNEAKFNWFKTGRNNGRSTDMTGQILPFYHPEFSDIIEMTGHFFLFSNWNVCYRYLESITTTFKRIPRFFTGDNLITILCSVHIQLHQMIKPLLIDIES